MEAEFCIGCCAGNFNFPCYFGSVDLEKRLALTEYRFPKFFSLLEDVLETGVLIRLLLGVPIACLMLRVAYI